MYSNGTRILFLVAQALLFHDVYAQVNTQADTLYNHAEVLADTLPQVLVSESVNIVPLQVATNHVAVKQSITGKSLSLLGITDVADALKLMSGIEVRDYGGMGGMKSLSIRHLGAQHTAVLYDGVPVSNCQAGQIDVSRFATDEHSLVSVTIGAPQDLLAPASIEPYSGTMQIQDACMRNNAGVSYSNWNTWDAKAGFTLGQVGTKLCYRHTDGNYPFTLTNGTLTTREERNNGRYDALTAQIAHAKEWDGGSLLRTQLYYHYSNQGLPGGIILYNMVSHQQMRDHNLLWQSRGRWVLSDRIEMVTIAKYNLATTWYDDGNAAANNSDEGYGKVYNYRQQEGFVSTALQYKGNLLTVSLVEDLALNTLWSDIKENPNPIRLTGNTAVRGRMSVPLWYHDVDGNRQTVNLSASIVFTHTNEWGANVPARRYVLPNVGVTVPVGGGVNLRASWRKALRMPSFNDLYYYQIGNHSLRPEQSRQWNLGVTWNSTGIITLQRFNLMLSADLYHYDVTDKIVAFPTTFAWKMVNHGHETINGINASFSTSYKFNRALQLSVSGSYSYQDADLPYTPQHTSAFGAIVQTPWFNLGYRVQVSSVRYSKLDHNWRYRLDAFADHSLTLSHTFGLGSNDAHLIHDIKVNLSIINLTNQQYEIIQYYPMPGRHCRIGVSFDF